MMFCMMDADADSFYWLCSLNYQYWHLSLVYEALSPSCNSTNKHRTAQPLFSAKTNKICYIFFCCCWCYNYKVLPLVLILSSNCQSFGKLCQQYRCTVEGRMIRRTFHATLTADTTAQEWNVFLPRLLLLHRQNTSKRHALCPYWTEFNTRKPS